MPVQGNESSVPYSRSTGAVAKISIIYGFAGSGSLFGCRSNVTSTAMHWMSGSHRRELENFLFCENYKWWPDWRLNRCQVSLVSLSTMHDLEESLFGTSSFGTGQCCCFDSRYRPTYHGLEQRYISPTIGKCRPLVVQAAHPNRQDTERIEVHVRENTPKARKLAIWLVLHAPYRNFPVWLVRWAWFTLALIWPFNVPKHTGLYPAYSSRYYCQLWIARSSREHSSRGEKMGVEPVREITHGAHPRRLIIHNLTSNSWDICSDPSIIKRQQYVAISYRYADIVPQTVDKSTRARLEEEFITKVQAVVSSVKESAYWIDLALVDQTGSPEEINKDLYRMADVYRSAKFTLIILFPPASVTEEEAWVSYGERLWTLPEALLSRELYYKFRDGNVTPITLHQLANRAYVHLAEESAIVNSYGLRDPLERLERLSLLKAALWRRKSSNLERILARSENQDSSPLFRADRVYALMGFFEHRIHPHAAETELQALIRLSMANDNDRLVERMVCLLPPEIPRTACWYAEQDEWGANLWDVEPEIQVVGMTEDHALILGGCRAVSIRWKDFPSIAFATRKSFKRTIATYLPNLFWEILIIGIYIEVLWWPIPLQERPMSVHAVLIAGIILMLLAPPLVAYGTSGRIVHAQPWLIGVKGLISAEEASDLLYGGTAFFAVPRTYYSASGTPLSQTEKGRFRRGDKAQLDILKPRNGGIEDDDLYTLVDTVSATIYYFRAARPPTVCLYVGRESGMGRFVLCSERCTINQLHKETVVRMPWHISQHMRACDWLALG